MAQASIAELLKEIRAARRRMNARNPDVLLLTKCEAAIVDLSYQLHAARRGRSARVRAWLARVFRVRRF